MENIRKFIKDAERGGFIVENLMLNGECINPNEFSSRSPMSLSDLLISPGAWRAVGRAREWLLIACSTCGKDVDISGNYYRCPEHGLMVGENYADYQWRLERTKFLFHLDEGLSIENALSKLSNDTRQ